MRNANEATMQANVLGNDQNPVNASRSEKGNGKTHVPLKLEGAPTAGHARDRAPGAKNKLRKSLVEDNLASNEAEAAPQAEVVALHPTVEAAVKSAAMASEAPIQDPGDDPPSKYTSAPNFAGRTGIKRKTTIILKNPKNYCLSKFLMAIRHGSLTLIDIARADELSKNLWLIMPEIASDSEMMHDVEGAYEAIGVPFIDRHAIPHFWTIRQYSTDGRELPSFAGALRAAEFAETHWARIKFVTNDWEYEEHRHPELIHAAWPSALVTYDDWVENAFAGRIIRASNHDVLEMARGKK
jgi:hypothetical protein